MLSHIREFSSVCEMLVTAGLFVSLIAVTSVTASLELLHVVFRHGQRTPADTYPKDPYINYSFEPVGWGQLTNKGKLDQYYQGSYLRERYGHFLGDIYSPAHTAAQSTDVDRTIMSMQLELAGLWPPAAAQKWHPSLNWQPIPVHMQPLNQDSLLLVRIPCTRYYEQLEIVMNSDEVRSQLARYDAKKLYKKLSEHTGSKISSPDDVQSLYSTLKAEAEFNLTLPAWTREYYPDRLAPLTSYSFVLNAYNNELQKLKGGPLLKKIVSDMTAKANDTLMPKERKLFMYAGHDSTISNLLRALQVWDPQIPGYGITVLIELHRDLDDHYVKLFLRNNTLHEPYLLTLPGCDQLCPLRTFVILTESVIPGDLTSACLPGDAAYTMGATAAP